MKIGRIVVCCVLAAAACGCGKKKSSSSLSSSSSDGFAKGQSKVMVSDKEDAETMAMRGRKLFVAITEANTEREAAGLASVWPKSAKDRDEDTEDIAGMDFSDSAKYFEELLDLKNNGTKDCQPYVKGIGLHDLSGGGVPTAPDNVKTLEGKYVGWSVLKGLRDEMGENIPVLVSANVAVSTLPTCGDIDGGLTMKVGIGRNQGAERDMFGNKYFVVVYKDGAACVIDAKDNTIGKFFRNASFSIPNDAVLEYLETGCR